MSRSAWAAAVAALMIVVSAAVVLWLLGRVPMCTCGTVKLWHGVVNSSENSQHLSDWYTFSHVIHGFGFYGLLWLVARRLPVRWRFVVAVLLEAMWEVAENTPFVIDRYRAATIALDYYGDSVVNSLSDIAAMMVGFALANRLPLLVVLGLAMVMEVVVGAIIRDNLTLNILMLLSPLDAVKQWQMGS
jgi:Protein of unknown function (DUF2585)